MILYWCFSSRISACNTFRSSAAALGQYRIKKVVQAILLKVSFREQPYPYEVHIRVLPAGYTGDSSAAYTLKPEGGSLELHAEKLA